ncbi:hypothetical protein QAD02_000527 [Eretmocerus hayati]|uniref:Uncharacterized protein n=1 Tax=Eretmocerus hayati TaxID=131215 RepID=A0ACC2NEA2_9HYME|nr:hypothetical protein QAD02_000527 [Eretmocerus hayati]
MQQKSEKSSKKTSQESKNKHQALILQSASIFDVDNDQDSSHPVNIRSPIKGAGSNSACNKEVSVSPTPEDCSNKESSSAVKIVEAGGSKQLVSQFLGISPEDMATIHSFLAMVKSQNLVKKDEESTGKKKGAQKKSTIIMKNELVPLPEGSSVLLPQFKIQSLMDSCQKKPRALVRKLMLAILGADTLKKSSPTGKGGWTPIPTNILEDVESFVRQNIKKKYPITYDEYSRCPTAQCATLRVPDKNSNIKGDKKKNKSAFESSAKKNFESDRSESEQSDSSSSGADFSSQDKKTVKKRAAHSKKAPKSSPNHSRVDDGEKDLTATYVSR